MNKKIYRVGLAARDGATNNASTANDLTEKNITPLGGFPHYGVVQNQYVMIRGGCVGPKKRIVVLRKPIFESTRRRFLEDIKMSFIDTSSKLGHGRFQTAEEKNKYFGVRASKAK